MAPGHCRVRQVRTDRLGDVPTAALSVREVQRAARYHQARDRRRAVLGAALLRGAVGEALGIEPHRVVVERCCDECGADHGRPTLPGTGLHASVSHSGDVVLVALSRGAPVGVDVEQLGQRFTAADAHLVTAPHEPVPTDERGFMTSWTRKEAVAKATGEGVRCPMSEIVVSPPHERVELVSYRSAPLRARLLDLDVGHGHVAAVAVLDGDVVVDHQPSPS